jgi:RNA polymerase sigma-70 factor (ECF subfamily)
MDMDSATVGLAGTDDLELVHRAATGDERAFDALMKRHNQRLYRAARGVLHDEPDAEEAVQEAWWKAYNHLAEFHGDAQPITWLTRIVINEALMRHRRNKTRDAVIQPVGQNADDNDSAEVALENSIMAPESTQPEQKASRGELRALIEARIDELPDRYRAVFMLRGVEGLSFAEIATTLGLTQTTVRVRFMRARGLLRKALHQDIDVSAEGAFSFAGERCDRIVAGVHARMQAADSHHA